MLVFASCLLTAAKEAGMKTPSESTMKVNNDDYKKEEFPHFAVFCVAQLARHMEAGEHWSNAEIIARIPSDKIKLVTVNDLCSLGFRGLC